MNIMFFFKYHSVFRKMFNDKNIPTIEGDGFKCKLYFFLFERFKTMLSKDKIWFIHQRT